MIHVEETKGEGSLCSIDGCGEVLEYNLLMCTEHWLALDRSIKEDLWMAWSRTDGLISGDDSKYEEEMAAVIKQANEYFKSKPNT